MPGRFHFILRTEIIEDRTGPVPEGGYHEVTVDLNSKELDRQSDARGWVNYKVGTSLRNAIETTDVDKEYWYVVFSPAMQSAFNFPEKVPFK